MKKYFLLASFAAMILMINHMSFAADGVVVAAATEPCSCCYCAGTAQGAPMSFACSPATQKIFGAKLRALVSQCPLKHRVPAAFPGGAVSCDPCVEPVPAMFPCEPCAASTPNCRVIRPFRAAFVARRAARLVQSPFACPPASMMSAPIAEPEPAPLVVPPVAVPPVGFSPTDLQGFAASVKQAGR